MSDFLLELRSEEIPARMQAGARANLDKLFREHLAASGIKVGEITVWSTPRRLALVARRLPERTEPVVAEVKGPRTSAPAQALEGFLRKTGLTQDQLTQRGDVWFAVSEMPGRAMSAVLAEAIPAIVSAFPWPKSMRWGAASRSSESVRWVRPLSGIVAILGEELVECEIAGVRSGVATLGHRFHHPGEITIGGAHDYAAKLAACHVIVDHEMREALIRERARTIAAAAGHDLVEDEGLVMENAGLTEWPVPLLGAFNPDFLEVPPEVIRLTARTNQKYFVCERDGKLTNAFVCTANIEATDGGAAIIAGNEKVLAARLADARFFWDQDRRKTLAQHAEGLSRITFHEKLGTLADKAERVARLAEWLATEGIVPGCDPASARQAALLCKADLVTEMVGEFPELQGVIGGYYARAEGLPNEVADAIRDHYKPVGQGDEVPTAPATVAVALADKLDTLSGFFVIDEAPSGSRDPFALRRAGLSIIRLVVSNKLHNWLSATDSIATLLEEKAQITYNQKLEQTRILENEELRNLPIQADDRTKYEINRRAVNAQDAAWRSHQAEYSFAAKYWGVGGDIIGFLIDRLKVQQRDAGVRHDLIDAVFALGNENDLVRLLARVHALQAFIGTEDGANLLIAYKRAANMLKKEGSAASPVAPMAARPNRGGSDPQSPIGPSLHGHGGGGAKTLAKSALPYAPELAESALIEALDAAMPRAAAAVAGEDFAGAMAALASLRAPIDAFFEQVTVNDADPAKRLARLALLDRFCAAVHNVADFSKIEG